MAPRVPKPAFRLAIPIGRDGIGLLLRVVFFGSALVFRNGSQMESKMDPKWGRIWTRFGIDFGAQNLKTEIEIEFELEFERKLQLETDLELQLGTEPEFVLGIQA